MNYYISSYKETETVQRKVSRHVVAKQCYTYRDTAYYSLNLLPKCSWLGKWA